VIKGERQRGIRAVMRRAPGRVYWAKAKILEAAGTSLGNLELKFAWEEAVPSGTYSRMAGEVSLDADNRKRYLCFKDKAELTGWNVVVRTCLQGVEKRRNISFGALYRVSAA